MCTFAVSWRYYSDLQEIFNVSWKPSWLISGRQAVLGAELTLYKIPRCNSCWLLLVGAKLVRGRRSDSFSGSEGKLHCIGSVPSHGTFLVKNKYIIMSTKKEVILILQINTIFLRKYFAFIWYLLISINIIQPNSPYPDWPKSVSNKHS